MHTNANMLYYLLFWTLWYIYLNGIGLFTLIIGNGTPTEAKGLIQDQDGYLINVFGFDVCDGTVIIDFYY